MHKLISSCIRDNGELFLILNGPHIRDKPVGLTSLSLTLALSLSLSTTHPIERVLGGHGDDVGVALDDASEGVTRVTDSLSSTELVDECRVVVGDPLRPAAGRRVRVREQLQVEGRNKISK